MLYAVCIGIVIGAVIRRMIKTTVAREVSRPGALAKESAGGAKRFAVCILALAFVAALFYNAMPAGQARGGSPPAPSAPTAPAAQDDAALPAGTEAMDRPSLLDTRDVTRITGAELAVQTHKWDGKVIEARAHCFYADVSEFRCMGAGARVDFTSLEPASAQAHLEHDCDTLAKMVGKKCLVTIRFRYRAFTDFDMGGLFGKVTLIAAEGDEGAVVAPTPALEGRAVSPRSPARSH